MKKIAFVVVWAGRLPGYFKLWLNSCRYNPTVDFLIFTNDRYPYELPENVKIYVLAFPEIKDKIQENFLFQISLGRAYKLCDYKPAYGEVFQEYLKEYDFWGYCDLDLIWGDIRKFITDDILEQNERIFTRGHCSLFRNCEKVNSYYRLLPSKGHLYYRSVYQTDKSCCFDEWAEHCGGGISVIFKENGIATYDEPVMADIRTGCGSFYVNRRPELGRVSCFLYENGRLFGCGGEKEKYREEFLYCHFQKRQVTITKSWKPDRYKLIPQCRAVDPDKRDISLKNLLEVKWLDIKSYLRKFR